MLGGRAIEETTEPSFLHPWRRRTLVVDFDGTIVEQETLALLVERFGNPEVHARSAGSLGGGVTLHQTIAAGYGTLCGSRREVTSWLLDHARIRPGFHELVSAARERGWRLVVVSSGVRELIEPLLAREGLLDLEVIANQLSDDGSRWRVVFHDEHVCDVCGEPCKRRTVQRLAGTDEVVYVGDGFSDACAAEAAHKVFARRRLESVLHERGVPMEHFEDFFDVLRALDQPDDGDALDDDRRRDDRFEARTARLEAEARLWREIAEKAASELAAWHELEARPGWRVFQQVMRTREKYAPAGSLRDRAVRRAVRAVLRGSALQAAAPSPATVGEGRAVLFISGRPGATQRYRCEHRAEQLRLLGATVDVAMLDDVDLGAAGQQYGCVVLHRVPFEMSLWRFVERARAHGCRVIYDTDDLVFETAADAHVPESVRHDQGLLRHRQALCFCDGVTVSTEPLRRHALRYHDRVRVVPNVASSAMVALADEAFRRRRVAGSEAVTVAYLSGTATHDGDFLEAATAVVRVLETSPHVRFLVVGRLNLDDRFDRFGDRVERVEFQPWEALPDTLARVDVNLAPLERGNPFAEAKSCIKYVEAGLAGVPTIASRRADFVRAIEHGHNGMLADSEGEWFEALRALVESDDLPERIGRAAYDDVRRHHATAVTGEHARAMLRELVADGDRGPLTVRWLGADDELARALAERGHAVHFDAHMQTHAPADVTIASDSSALDDVARSESLFRCVYVDKAPSRLRDDVLYVCRGSSLAQRLHELVERPVEVIPDDCDDATAAAQLDAILQRTCFIRSPGDRPGASSGE
jgi:2,3-diketo-5-methylthio-1-phosphopentane phosphatase